MQLQGWGSHQSTICLTGEKRIGCTNCRDCKTNTGLPGRGPSRLSATIYETNMPNTSKQCPLWPMIYLSHRLSVAVITNAYCCGVTMFWYSTAASMTQTKAAMCPRHIVQEHKLSGESWSRHVETCRRDKGLLQGAQKESDPVTPKTTPQGHSVPIGGRKARRCHSRPPLWMLHCVHGSLAACSRRLPPRVAPKAHLFIGARMTCMLRVCLATMSTCLCRIPMFRTPAWALG